MCRNRLPIKYTTSHSGASNRLWGTDRSACVFLHLFVCTRPPFASRPRADEQASTTRRVARQKCGNSQKSRRRVKRARGEPRRGGVEVGGRNPLVETEPWRCSPPDIHVGCGGGFGGFQEEIASMEVLVNASSDLVDWGLPQHHVASEPTI
jgi:hypothetical protein